MTFVPHSRVLPRALWRPALFFFAVAQIFLSFAPLLEPDGPNARAHVEEAGITLHHAHNEADCAACTARGLLANANIERPAVPAVGPVACLLARTSAFSSESAWTLHARSRAPPV